MAITVDIKRSASPLYLLNGKPAFYWSGLCGTGTVKPCWNLACRHPTLLQRGRNMTNKCISKQKM